MQIRLKFKMYYCKPIQIEEGLFLLDYYSNLCHYGMKPLYNMSPDIYSLNAWLGLFLALPDGALQAGKQRRRCKSCN